METLNVALTPDLLDRVRQEVIDQELSSMSELVRRAVGDYLRRMDKRRNRDADDGAYDRAGA